MTTSESVNEIAAALAKAQSQMKNAALNKVNPHFKSKYADLAGIRDTVIPALTANGIAVVQTLEASAVLTRLLHTSGQWIESACPIPPAPDMQKMGSAITYARRYSLSAICGIAADEDDDANSVSDVPTQQTRQAAKPAGYVEWLAGFAKEAGKGLPAMRAAYKAAPAACRDYLTHHDNDTYEDLKALAAEADKAAA
jgi:hypothetical protein